MLSTELTDLITTLSGQFSYLSNSHKYRDKEGKTYSPSDAAQEILNRLAVSHSTVYVPHADQGELILTTIKEKLSETTQKKKKLQTTRVTANAKASTYSTGLDTKLVENPLWKPSKPFNCLDALWCANLVTDDHQVLYRRKPTGAYEIIGTSGGRMNESVAASLERTQKIPDVFEFTKSQLDILSTFAAKSQEFEQEGPARLLSLMIPQGEGESITLKEYLGVTDDNMPTNNEHVISLLVYKFMNTRMPASIFFGLLKLYKYYNIFKGEDGKDHPVFQGFVCRTGDGAAPTKRSYFSNILEHYQEYLGCIESRPKAVSMDGSEPAFGLFNKAMWEADVAKYGDLKYEDSKLVKTYLDPMDSDQKNFVCAWFYAVFMNLTVVISLLHQDKGGTLKTTIKQIMRTMIKIYYDADVCFCMKRDQLCNPQYLFDSKRLLSIADALFVDYDEPPTKGEFWEQIKAITGGVKVDFPIKELYSNPYMVSGSPLFYIGSNKPVYLQDKGAFKRRIACIITSANDTWKLISKEDIEKINNDVEVQKREFHLLMRLGKKAYNAILEKYGSMAEASVRMPSIASQLDAQSPWDEYLERFYQSLFDNGEESIKIANETADMKLEAWKIKHKTSLKIDHLAMVNYFKMIHSDNVTKPFKIGKVCVRGWILHKVDVNVENAEESNFEELGLDEHGEPIPAAPELVSSKRFYKGNELPFTLDDSDNEDEYGNPIMGLM